MPANLTEPNAMAYNVENGHPWHRLGVSNIGYMTIDEALEAIGCGDEQITFQDMFVIDPDKYDEYEQSDFNGQVQVPSHTAIYSSVYGVMGVHKSRYSIMTPREIMDISYDVIGLDRGDAKLDTIGRLGDVGEKFFAYVRADDLVIDPNGIADTIEQGYVIATSFDGTLPSLIGRSNIRVVCQNTLTLAIDTGRAFLKARHTSGAEDRLRMLAELNDYAGALDAKMNKRAEQMLRVSGTKARDTVMNEFWSLDGDMTDATHTKRQQSRATFESILNGPDNLNTRLVGDNGWAVYNAFTEYADHRLEVRGSDKDRVRAERAVFPGAVQNQKIQAADMILALAN